MRVDDDSADRVQQEIRAHDRKTQEQEGKRRTEETTAFDRALSSKQQTASTAQVRKQTAFQGKLAKQAKDKGDRASGRASRGKAEADASIQASSQRRAEAGEATDRSEATFQAEIHQGDDALATREGDGREGQASSASRKGDQRRQDALEAEKASSGRGARGPARSRTEGADSDGGGGQRGSGQGGQQQAAAFRLPNAALMAPPPVAVPRGGGGAEALRKLAQEIAQRIVQSARVGVNRQGMPEMQIELKSEVLQGLKVKVSGRHGRVRATFASGDRAVLQQLRSGLADLRESLTARGLKVDALEIEEER